MIRRFRPGVLALPLLLGACSLFSAPGAAGVDAVPAPSPEATPRALSELFDRVRAPGLEDRRFGYRSYWSVVEPHLGGAVGSRLAGRSAEGRRIRHLTFGSGPVQVLLWSQMHGNESTASMSLADLVRFLDTEPDHPLARRLAERLTIHMIPMLNPDGAERFRRRNAQGIDVNRDARALATPEGRILKAVRDRVEPAFGFNLHDQNAAIRVSGTDRGVAIALLAPAFNEARDVDGKRRRAMQVAALLRESMEPLVGEHIAKYDDTFEPRAFGDLMGAWGASTVLIEAGAWAGDPQKQYLRRANFVGILAALDGIATERYLAFDPNDYESLPFNGRRVADLLFLGGTVVAPGVPELRADILVNYDRPLLKQDGHIVDIGDLAGVEAQDTVDARGLYLVALPEALGLDGSLDLGRPAWFLLSDDPQGRQVRTPFRGGPEEPETGPGGRGAAEAAR